MYYIKYNIEIAFKRIINYSVEINYKFIGASILLRIFWK